MPFCANCGEIVSGKQSEACASCGKVGIAQTAAGLEETSFNSSKSRQTYMNAYLSSGLVESIESGTSKSSDGVDAGLKKLLLDQVSLPKHVTAAATPSQPQNKPPASESPNRVCPKCDKVVNGRGIAFESGHFYHPSCFTCFFCERQLAASDKLFTHDGNPVCQQCSNVKDSRPKPADQLEKAIAYTGDASSSLQNSVQKFLNDSGAVASANARLRELCDDCLEPIAAFEEKIILQKYGKQYHSRCFRCQHCHTVIKGSKFLSVNGKFVHCECGDAAGAAQAGTLNADKCAKCFNSIYAGKYFEFDGKVYHKACFTCETCKREIGTSSFSLVTNKVYCASCVEKQLASVQQKLSTTPPASLSRNNSSQTSLNRTKLTSDALKSGGGQDCTLCNKRVYPQEEAFGPNVTKWHKKCLTCMRCRKQLDSSAVLRRDESNAALLLCRGCS